MSVIYAPKVREFDPKGALFAILIVVALVVVASKLWFYQVASASKLQEVAQVTGEASVYKIAPRGRILDRSGVLLAGVESSLVVTAKPKGALKNEEALPEVAEILGVDQATLRETLDENSWAGDLPTPIFAGAKIQAASRIAELSYRWPEYAVETRPVRYYTEPKALAHLMGYVRTPSAEDVKRLKGLGIRPAEVVGKSGLERTYERELMGEPGRETLWVDARRRPVRSMGIDQAVPGETLVLSLDINLQKRAMELLSGRRGAVVALDAATGEVLCLVSSPTFDSSIFLRPVSTATYKALQGDPAQPMFARSIAAAYPPGSTFKIVTTLAAATVGKFDQNRAAYCAGYYRMGNRNFKCLGNHGAVTYAKAFAKSCNAYFADLGVRAGSKAMRDTCAELGLGERLGLDVTGEAKGLVATEEWWAKHRDRKFSLGDLVNFSVGQGELACTPLQMANIVCTVANRGRVTRPRLLHAVIDEKGKSSSLPPEVIGQLNVPDETYDVIENAMLGVVEHGTARRQRIPGLLWGGKTGSAENRKDRQTHSWFVAMAPINDPKIVLSVIVENAGHGSDVAAPIAASMIRQALIKPQGKSNTDRSAAIVSASLNRR